MPASKPTDVSLAHARPGSALTTAEVRAVASELVRLAKRDGRVTPESFLEAATPVESPIHHLFNWDDPSAAVQHRLLQARQIVRSIVFRPIGVKVTPPIQKYTSCGAATPTRTVQARLTTSSSSSHTATASATIPQTANAQAAREFHVDEVRATLARIESRAGFEDLIRAAWDAGYVFALLREKQTPTVD